MSVKWEEIINNMDEMRNRAHFFRFMSGCMVSINCGIFLSGSLYVFAAPDNFARCCDLISALIQLPAIVINIRSAIDSNRRFGTLTSLIKDLRGVQSMNMGVATASEIEMRHDQIMAGFENLIRK